MTKKMLAVVAIAIACVIPSCQTEDDNLITKREVPQNVLDQIHQLGFSTHNVIPDDDGYIVEGDIMLRHADLASHPDSKLLRIAEVEQYHTFNLVSAGSQRTITVSSSGSVSASVSSAIDDAIDRYNAENLLINFMRVASGGDINVRVVNGGNYIASAGFPSNGDPYDEVKFNRRYEDFSAGFLATVMAHEIGHCIGFRHTDYMDRSFSCGSGGNEGQETTGVGAVHIPGTPTGPDEASWMLSCLSRTTNRPFNSNDKTALDYLY